MSAFPETRHFSQAFVGRSVGILRISRVKQVSTSNRPPIDRIPSNEYTLSVRRTCPLKLSPCSQSSKKISLPFLPCSRSRSFIFVAKVSMKEVWTDGHQQREPAGHRQGVGRGAQTARRLKEARLRTARRRYRETDGQTVSSWGSNQERKCLTIRKRPFFNPQKFKADSAKFLNGVICGLSDRSGSEGAERSHRSGAQMPEQRRAGQLVST